MDFLIQYSKRNWVLRPSSQRGRQWLESNFHSGREMTIPAEHGPMFMRNFSAEYLIVGTMILHNPVNVPKDRER
jgi:hypothetical protein